MDLTHEKKNIQWECWGLTIDNDLTMTTLLNLIIPLIAIDNDSVLGFIFTFTPCRDSGNYNDAADKRWR